MRRTGSKASSSDMERGEGSIWANCYYGVDIVAVQNATLHFFKIVENNRNEQRVGKFNILQTNGGGSVRSKFSSRDSKLTGCNPHPSICGYNASPIFIFGDISVSENLELARWLSGLKD